MTIEYLKHTLYDSAKIFNTLWPEILIMTLVIGTDPTLTRKTKQNFKMIFNNGIFMKCNYKQKLYRLVYEKTRHYSMYNI